MIKISPELHQELTEELPQFRQSSEKFFRKEIKVNEYKGLSGKFGSYAERGGNSAMIRFRLPGGQITRDQAAFIADSVRKYNLKNIHFTTGQSIQFHGLDGDTACDLAESCPAHDIFTRGGGGDHPRNLLASPLRGLTDEDYFDITPYTDAAAAYILTLIRTVEFPRKLKTCFTCGPHNDVHATFRDLGFVARPDKTFDVYAAGGLGPNPQMGIKVGSAVDPAKILYYIKAMALLFSDKGNYKSRAKARTRYIQVELGSEVFYNTFQDYLKKVEASEQLDILPQTTAGPVKTGPDRQLNSPRIHKQKQPGLYYVTYHPIGGDPSQEVFLALLDKAAHTEGCELRLTPEEGLYIINCTADEAEAFAAITTDSAANTFETSVSCVGATVCQVGFQDSHGLLERIVEKVHPCNFADGVLPQIHISGCPSSCSAHQAAPIGLYGAVKLVDQKPVKAFALLVGGSADFNQEAFGTQAAIIAEDLIPDFFVELGKAVADDQAVFTDWIKTHKAQFDAIVEKYA